MWTGHCFNKANLAMREQIRASAHPALSSTVALTPTVTLTATASNTGGYTGTETDTTTVKNTDDDTNGITFAGPFPITRSLPIT